MIAPAIFSTPTDQRAAVNGWLISAAKGLRKRIASINELGVARDAAARALRGEPPNDSSSAGCLTASRHRRKIRARAYDLTLTALHIGKLELVHFLLEADANQHVTVCQRERNSSVVSINPKQGEVA